ncbi:hypothetical protein HO662_02875 [Streptococcus suis]|uniref:hypothetical protein n=1 Tax=Streptococcus suis TaxID=1307 RepID=UPI00188E13C6|nr:hypothetical protein [Streptococcus suis]NQH31088.1 hypothetical protein [Streptococcus suis]
MRLTYQRLSIATLFQLQDLMVCVLLDGYDFMSHFIAVDTKSVAFADKRFTVYQAIQNICHPLTVYLSL